MPSTRGWSVPQRRVLLSAIAVIIGVFVLCGGFGMGNKWPVVGVGAGFIALGLAFFVLSALNSRATSEIEGVAHVIDRTPPPVGVSTGRCRMHLAVSARGLDDISVKIRDSAVPVAKWPDRGADLPVMVAISNPQKVRVLWKLVHTHSQAAADRDRIRTVRRTVTVMDDDANLDDLGLADPVDAGWTSAYDEPDDASPVAEPAMAGTATKVIELDVMDPSVMRWSSTPSRPAPFADEPDSEQDEGASDAGDASSAVGSRMASSSASMSDTAAPGPATATATVGFAAAATPATPSSPTSAEPSDSPGTTSAGGSPTEPPRPRPPGTRPSPRRRRTTPAVDDPASAATAFDADDAPRNDANLSDLDSSDAEASEAEPSEADPGVAEPSDTQADDATMAGGNRVTPGGAPLPRREPPDWPPRSAAAAAAWTHQWDDADNEARPADEDDEDTPILDSMNGVGPDRAAGDGDELPATGRVPRDAIIAIDIGDERAEGVDGEVDDAVDVAHDRGFGEPASGEAHIPRNRPVPPDELFDQDALDPLDETSDDGPGYSPDIGYARNASYDDDTAYSDDADYAGTDRDDAGSDGSDADSEATDRRERG